MQGMQMNVDGKAFTPAPKTDDDLSHSSVSVEAGMSSVTWADIEDALSEEWEIGGLAMSTEAIRALVAGE